MGEGTQSNGLPKEEREKSGACRRKVTKMLTNCNCDGKLELDVLSLSRTGAYFR